MTNSFRDFFGEVKPIKLKEPLAETLGAFKEKDAVLEYSFAAVVKMAGHACPTVSAAYLCCRKALEKLYPQEIPVRGNISITVYGEADETVYGVMAQVFSFITGACSSTGFRGLVHKFKRKDLLRFKSQKVDRDAMCFEFKRLDNKQAVLVKIYPGRMPSLGEKEDQMGRLLEKTIWEAVKEDEIVEFQNLWMEKVKKIIVDQEAIDDWMKLENRES